LTDRTASPHPPAQERKAPRARPWEAAGRRRSLLLAALLCGAAQLPQAPAAKPAPPPPATLASELAKNFAPTTQNFDYIRRVVNIPMRDGVKLHTVILIPRGARRAPILLTRTPYGADSRFGKITSAHIAAVMDSGDVADELVAHDNYIRVIQDVRGKYGSEGDYVMTRPLRGPLNPTEVDHATDTYDTIDWLVNNTPESNGRVGILGISYDGFTSLMALFHPHPALRAAVPINAMVDGWMGDDWFHHGAFRQDSLVYAQTQEATRDSHIDWWSDHYDDYDSWLSAGSAGDMAKLHGLDQVGFAGKLMAHPAYDSFWQDQAIDRLLAKTPPSVPTMLVHSLWDQEDIYGNIAVWNAIKSKVPDNLYLVIGPWYHHQERLNGDAVGNIAFGSDTAAYFRANLLRPFLDHYLKDDAPPLPIAHVEAFETGTNQWLHLKTWPAGCEDASCAIKPTPLYLQPGGKLGPVVPAPNVPGFDSYVSDPAHPAPYLPRPIHIEDDGESSWQTWLTSDQREASSRTDVLTYASPVLSAPLKIAGQPVANLVASTTGTDGDFVVKLIDAYPDEMGRDPKLGGYELMISADIIRARYRDDPSKPSPMPSDQKQTIKFALPTANHVFLPGHRVMVQIQSSWFPLYDRNPQTYVKNIFFAKPTDYRRATIKIFNATPNPSFIDLPVVK
jgi:putative CocE/NonD family hydrolase